MLMNSLIKLTNELIINYLSAKALVFTYHIKHLGELLIYKQIYSAPSFKLCSLHRLYRRHHRVWESHSYCTHFLFLFCCMHIFQKLTCYLFVQCVCVFIPFYFCSIPEVDPNFRAWLQISSLSQTYSQFTPSLKAAEIAGITECRQGICLPLSTKAALYSKLMRFKQVQILPLTPKQPSGHCSAVFSALIFKNLEPKRS